MFRDWEEGSVCEALAGKVWGSAFEARIQVKAVTRGFHSSTPMENEMQGTPRDYKSPILPTQRRTTYKSRCLNLGGK